MKLRTYGNYFGRLSKKKIQNSLFQKTLSIRSVGKGKLSISFFYTDPEYYLPLDSKTITYIRKHKIKYTFNTIEDYLFVSNEAQNVLNKKPYEISYFAWEDRDLHQITVADDDSKIGSVRTLLGKLDELNDEIYEEDVLFFYRGHASTKYGLNPSIFRNNHIFSEDKLFKDIITRCPIDFAECGCTFEKLVKMQHYSLPTRLLDITSNPLVALFFACKNYNADEENEDGRLYRFEVKESDVKYFDSDAVSVVANISRRPKDFSIETIKHKDKDDFNEEIPIQYLLHEIRSEKPHFLDLIESEHIESVFCVKPKLDNPRIIRQEGAFFIFGINNDKSQPAIFDIEYKSFIINKSDKKRILNQLDVLGINESTLFPEIEHVAKHLKDKLK